MGCDGRIEAWFAVEKAIKGKDGVGIQSVNLRGGSLVVVLSTGEEIDLGGMYYVTEFTLDNLRNASHEQEVYPCNASAIAEALNKGKIILVPMSEGEIGYVVADAYYEDLLYFTVWDAHYLRSYSFEIPLQDTEILSPYVTVKDIQRQLVSGVTIKTINGESILGEGDITISGGGASVDEPHYTTASDVEVAPNTSAVLEHWAVSVHFRLTAPVDFTKVNEYSIVVRNFGNSITFDKSIIWANNNTPPLNGSGLGVIEFRIKCIKFDDDGVKYLGSYNQYSL